MRFFLLFAAAVARVASAETERPGPPRRARAAPVPERSCEQGAPPPSAPYGPPPSAPYGPHGPRGVMSLLEASRRGMVVSVEEALRTGGEDVNAVGEDGRGPIHVAAARGHTLVVDALPFWGANLDLRTPDGDTALHLAARADAGDVVAALLAHGAECDTPNNVKITPLYDAAQNGSLASTRHLLAAGAAVDGARDDGGFTPLHAAAWQGHAAVVEALLQKDADVNFKHRTHGGTALHMAVYYGHVDVARVLLRWGAGIDERMHKGATPLFLAIERGPVESARLLLRWGADAEIPREDGETVFTAHFDKMVDIRALLAEDALAAVEPGDFDYEPADFARLTGQRRFWDPPEPLVRFLRVLLAAGATIVVVKVDIRDKARELAERASEALRPKPAVIDDDEWD